MQPSPAGPGFDISVVVIVYNDAERLPRAVRSVLNQTLRGVEVLIVDDCSTDASPAVARGFAEQYPDRVRFFQLTRNSGGCGTPRNLGIDQARGRQVMFLDSDDELERNACRNFLEAALRTGADLVSGQCVRVYVDSRAGKTIDWYPWLYQRSRTLESIAELPDLLVFDTLSTNKCYRKDFLVAHRVRFPEGIHYEDLLFSAQAYLAARRIALIPNRVYFWNVVDKAKTRSISNRRHEIANFADRLEIHRRIDELFDTYGGTPHGNRTTRAVAARDERTARADSASAGHPGLMELRLHKDIKFLKHDLVLHLRDLPFLDDGYRDRFAELAIDYLSGVSPAAFRALEPIQAVCAYLLMHQDWDRLLPAIDSLINRSKLSSPLVVREGRVYWCAEHLADPDGRAALDVTSLGFHTRPLDRLHLRNRLSDYTEEPGGLVRLAGEIVNPLGAVRPGERLRGELEFRARRRSLQTFRFPVTELHHAGTAITWRTSVALADRLRPVGIVDAVWDVRLLLTADGERTTTRVTVGDTQLIGGTLRARPRLTRLVANTWRPVVSRKGHLAFQLAPSGTLTERVSGYTLRAAQGRPGAMARAAFGRLWAARRTLHSGETKIRVYHRVLCRLPIRKGLVVFESQLGLQYGDNPKAIYQELRRQGVPIRAIWSYAGSPKGFPTDAKLVPRWSWRYLMALARAEFWIDNQGFPLKLDKRPATTYLQTWHGTALKCMGFDEARRQAAAQPERQAFQRSIDRFDRFLVRGEYDVRTLVRAYRLRDGVPLRCGYPRNDALVRAAADHAGRDDGRPGSGWNGAWSRDASTQVLAERLGVPEGHRVVLYAPTFRADPDGRVSRRFELPFDVRRFIDECGDRHTLLVRSHYLHHAVLPPAAPGQVIDVTDEHDVTPLLLLADALITDYSSVMFDYALLDRPMIFYAYDHDSYANDTRGTYFDMVERVPGPVARTEDELFAALVDLDAVGKEYARARREFARDFGEYDRGDAARTIVEQFFWTVGLLPRRRP